MEHTTFAKKTVVLAALGALSLMAATVRADETETEPTPVNITVEIGATGDKGIASTINNAEASVTWDDEWLKKEGGLGENQPFGGLTVTGKENADAITVMSDGSLKIAFGKDANKSDNADVTFNSVNLDVKDGGAFSNSSHVQITNGGSLTVTNGDFENGEGGVIELNGTKFDLSVTKAELVGNFENSGTIVLSGNASMTVGSDKVMDVTSDDELTLKVGNITIGEDAVLTNKDQGYRVQNKPEEQGDTEGAEDDVAVDKTLVQFGTVSVADGGKFVNAADALSSGTKLVLEGANTVKIGEGGESVWNTLNLTKVGGSMNLSSFVAGIDDQSAQGDFRVTGALVIDKFAEGGDFTINGSTDAKVFADGIDISVGSHVTAGALEQAKAGDGLSWKTEEKPVVGTLKLTGFTATFKEAAETPEEGEKAVEDEGEATTNGSWTYKKFGDVTAVNTKVEISGARPIAAQGSTDPYAGNGYTPSLQMSSLTLGGTSMNISYDVDVEKIKEAVNTAWKGEDKIDMEGWTKDNILEKLDTLLKDEKYADLKSSLEADRADLEEKLAGSLTEAKDVGSTISGSDLAIGTLTLALKNGTVKVEKPFAPASSGENDNENTTTQDEGDTETDTTPETVTITGNETYDLGKLSLTVTDSNLDVDTLDVQTGTVTLTGSNMMVGNVKTLNGSLTVSDGYLGLNVTTGVSDDIIKTTGTTVEVGSPVTIGANGQLNFVDKPQTGTLAQGDETTSDTEEHAIGFFTKTDIVFDGKNFNSEALFSQDRTDGNKGKVTVGKGGSINVKATNLSWGVYKLFDEETLDTTGLTGGEEGDIKVEVSDETVNGLWKDAVGDKISADGNEIVVGGKTIEGSGLDIGAVNLANSVVAGDRGSALDKVLFNHILSNGKSLEEISNTINSITAMGAVAGLTAMTVDFGAYVTDQVEHHASTIPHQQEGWWVQPIAGKLKSDDLAVGGMKGGYSIDTVGIMGGFDKKLRNGDTIGVAASYQSGDADSEGNALPVSTDVTNYGLHLWHARQFDAYRLMGMFSYSKTSGDAKMNYVGNEITSDLGATEISIGARADKEFKWGTVRMIPHAGVRASMIDVDDYTIEMGSEELFKVSEDKLWIFEVPVGVTFASSFEYARWNVQPYVDLTVRGRFGDTDSTFTLEGSNTSDSMKYDVTGDVIGDLRIGYMSTFQDLNLGMSYGLSAGDGGRQNHQLEATLRIDF